MRNRISRLKEQSSRRSTARWPCSAATAAQLVRVALVGYTNVGKSTLMNLIAKSEVFAENKLFATLDTTVRKVVLENLPFLLSDTVGFIRKLPHQLVESFKSTLDEVREADLLLHVVDISHPSFEEQIAVVKQTLQEIGAGDKPVFLIFNKIDAYTYVRKDEDDLTPSTRENRLTRRSEEKLDRPGQHALHFPVGPQADEYRQVPARFVRHGARDTRRALSVQQFLVLTEPKLTAADYDDNEYWTGKMIPC